MNKPKSTDWFSSWFDTDYYHILYNHRDDTEAQDFIDKLFAELNPQKSDLILDLACGRGRHAVYMNQKGFDVVGYDLSSESICHAKEFENDKLHFEVRDMREDLGDSRFDWVFNLFTSFGYFEHPEDDIVAITSIAKSLKTGGKLVLDFMNAQRVAKRLVPEEHKHAEGIDFYIERFTRGKHIIKQIRFNADGRDWKFEEKVKIITKSDFKHLCEQAGLRLVDHFGSLNLDEFDESSSDRFILIAEKI